MKLATIFGVAIILGVFGCATSDTQKADKTDSDVEMLTPDTDMGTDDDSPLPPIRIEAECAFDSAAGDCGGAYSGMNSGDAAATQLTYEDTTVTGFPDGEWIAFPALSLSGYNHLRVRVKGQEGAGLSLRLDAPDGQLLAMYTLSEEAEQEWQELTFRLYRTAFDASRAYTLYLVGVDNDSAEPVTLDWLELRDDTPELPYLDDALPIADRVADLVSRMTVEEKAGQMAQGSVNGASATEAVAYMLGSVLAGGGEGPVPYTPVDWYEHTRTYHETVISRSRLRIPIIYGIDAVHGHAKVSGATIFPHNIGMGATRDAELAFEMGEVVAKEMTATGCRWSFGPAVSVARDERWGRTYESYGENPEIAASMANTIDGMQGDHFNENFAVISTAKHYLGDGGTVWGTSTVDGGSIDQGDAQMTEAALRAIHLAPYHTAVNLGVGALMPSYSSFNGEKMHESSYWLTDVLRGEMGYEGFIISDWDAILQISTSFSAAVRTSINAGVDMAMFPYRFDQFVNFVSGAPDNGISIDRLDEAVSRILTAKIRLGLFENPYGNPDLIGEVFSAAHRDVARRAVRESLVLLKNDSNFLPLSADQTVCVTGSGADSLKAQMGGWTLGWQEPYNTSRLQGDTILDALTVFLETHTGSVVEEGCDVGIRVVSEELMTYAEYLGDDADPAHDDSGECTATEGCVVVVLSGRPVNIEDVLAQPDSKAVVMGWYPGSEGGGIIDVLYAVDGADFSGTLPMTWKKDAVNTPINFCDDTIPGQCGDVGEHYSDAAAAPAEVLFPYGYGLKY
ncbi:MAG: glycoside hydrolase family 3 C-terminal domain-containing protein [Deltaproteobacteria bacterium]|nr:glycoside hydrolase family 3 C-terminal domain-containing protein [Deltaproteobacteria bacterium]MBN2672980.1 glycoside hydrolase family 3 C-terminal domain-containing protein [Deltaproteobacteria bacterium]